MRFFLRLLAAATLLGGVMAPAVFAHTSDYKLVNATVTGLGGLGRDFEFLDGNGKLRRLSGLNGNVVAVFFGFSNCPDACPGFLAKASVVSEMLGKDSERFKVVFVTVDPERDTRVVLGRYLDLFGDNITGARIPGGGLSQLTADFGISSQIATDANGDIVISHSIGAFLFDSDGNARTYLSGSKSTNEFLGEVQKLMGDA